MFFSRHSSISAQNTAVDYSSVVPPGALRRMSPVLKMSAFTGLSVLKEQEGPVDGIIVGTGLGCIDDTFRFLKEFTGAGQGPVSPTSFIQSTHNTIAGQLALLSGIKGYNITFSQQGHSFEMALKDAQRLFILKEAESLLVGGADENTEELSALMALLAERYQSPLPVIGGGAAFFVVDAVQNKSSNARLLEIQTFKKGEIPKMLDRAAQEAGSFDLILDGTDSLSLENSLSYKKLTGEMHTSTALALAMALDAMQDPGAWKRDTCDRVLILNRFFDQGSWIALQKL